MLTSNEYEIARKRTLSHLEKAGIIITEEEKKNITVFDFGFEDLDRIGLELLVYVNTQRVCAKELVLFPGQTCVEHLHPSVGAVAGKEETFRCRWGKVYLYVPGEPTPNLAVEVPKEMREHVSVFHEIEMVPGRQYTLLPDTLHWFQAGREGAVISEFSTTNTDEIDQFTDPRIKR